MKTFTEPLRELEAMIDAYERGAQAVAKIVSYGADEAMNEYNRKV